MPSNIRVEHGDSRDVLKTIADSSIDSCVCDPPYALVSIQKRFGKPGSAPALHGKDGLYARASAGFMGQQWDTGEVAFDPAFWAEVLRVLKPGGHLLAFSGTRTYHRMAVAIEDAGFEIRDQIGWAYGSGFPKSHNVSKGIDKAAGAEREVVTEGKPVKRMIPGADQNKDGWIKDNGREYVPTETAPATDASRQWEGWGTALKPAWEPICMARKPPIGTVAENVLQHGTGAINIDGCRVETDQDQSRPQGKDIRGGNFGGGAEDKRSTIITGGSPLGRHPANIIHDGSEEVIAAFPQAPGQQAAVRPDSGSGQKTDAILGKFATNSNHDPRGDSGSAARFFYSAKADKGDRLGSKHPTVKPVDLMAYLCRLVTRPGGVVLDPFAGSGTTGMACMREGFDAILIEREAQFVEDIKRRIAHVSGQDGELFR